MSRLSLLRCWLGILLLLCYDAAKVPSQATSTPQFKATANLVRVMVVVRDLRGKAIRNLRASDLSVTDDWQNTDGPVSGPS
jgi:hypothetical protein